MKHDLMVTLEVSEPAWSALKDLGQTGLFGTTIPEVARTLLYERIRSVHGLEARR